MAITIENKALDFMLEIINDTRELLDNVHCYDTPEYYKLKHVISILEGQEVDIDNLPEEDDE